MPTILKIIGGLALIGAGAVYSYRTGEVPTKAHIKKKCKAGAIKGWDKFKVVVIDPWIANMQEEQQAAKTPTASN